MSGRRAAGAGQDAQAAAAQLAAFQDAAAQLAAAQEAAAHEALFQEADLHEALLQDALFQEASALAAFAQLATSKTSPPARSETTNWSSPRLGFGGFKTCVAAFALTSPTPRPMPAAVGCALTMSAPLTWSGVQLGWC